MHVLLKIERFIQLQEFLNVRSPHRQPSVLGAYTFVIIRLLLFRFSFVRLDQLQRYNYEWY